MLSGAAPPSGTAVRSKVMPEVIGVFLESLIVPANEYPVNPLGPVPIDVGYFTSITSPLTNPSPRIPSPKIISGFLVSASSKKKTLLILFTVVISVACKYASVTVPRVTSTVIAEVSALRLPKMNLCLSDSVFTNVSVMNIPSYATTSVNVALPSNVLTDTIKSLGMEKI